MRVTLIAGNWKMNKLRKEALAFAQDLTALLPPSHNSELLICPPFTLLWELQPLLAKAGVRMGAQDLFWDDNGAYTGEISASMLLDAGCTHVIIGHSERRQVIGESDLIINKKMHKACREGLIPILCIGETLEERKAGKAEKVVAGQLKQALAGLSSEGMDKLVIAYEPVWAIGTGVNASGQDAQNTCAFIRGQLEEYYGPQLAAAVRILYGGSVKEENIKEFLQQADIDGALIGGASLDAAVFANIVRLGEND
jgi:triosephosphate isomerase